ncbi:unnamed protein product [Haemonchus placei]|uniref:CACTA en-spm transposon protein n=1 Tax=Haemonchus placei TaxID=6290 RepID=A0A158QQC1_HAEPC|nr:unnamed protein product [Haemonchus placei]
MHNHFVGGGGDFLSDDITSEGLCDSDSDDAMQEVEEYFFELLVDMEIVTRLRSAYPTKIILAQAYSEIQAEMRVLMFILLLLIALCTSLPFPQFGADDWGNTYVGSKDAHLWITCATARCAGKR